LHGLPLRSLYHPTALEAWAMVKDALAGTPPD
jgi:hypothetical protein